MSNRGERISTGMTICTKCRDLVEVSFLSRRQGQIMRAFVQGKTVKEIQEEFFISEPTVYSHKMAILRATGCRDVVALCRWAYQQGLMEMLGWDENC